LLGHLALADKAYDATIRLGITTTTDDAEGEIIAERPADAVGDEQIAAAIRDLTGAISQVPAVVSAIKVDGVRAYQRVRSGEQVELAPRPVTVSSFELIRRRGEELDVHVECSTGTYVRALARDLGGALGVGGHLTALRRTRVGGFTLADASTLDDLADSFQVTPVADAARTAFPTITVGSDEAVRIGHGQRLVLDIEDGMTAVLDPGGRLVALVERRDGVAQPTAVFASQADLST
jgi:tRNA pseudouridine55 synthase